VTATRYVIDTSAESREPRAEVRSRLAPLREAGLVSTCGVLDLEWLFTARSGNEHRLMRNDRADVYRTIPVDAAVLGRAAEVQGLLADRGNHRAVSIVNLVIAACAEVAHHTVLHYDADFDRIAEVTGQPVEWVVPRGSVP
jgi:predicted nucleic acid-binding protein